MFCGVDSFLHLYMGSGEGIHVVRLALKRFYTLSLFTVPSSNLQKIICLITREAVQKKAPFLEYLVQKKTEKRAHQWSRVHKENHNIKPIHWRKMFADRVLKKQDGKREPTLESCLVASTQVKLNAYAMHTLKLMYTNMKIINQMNKT